MLVSKDKVDYDENRNFSAFDIMPTILKEIGADWDSERLGLGVSMKSHQEANLLENYSYKEAGRKIERRNWKYKKFYDDE